MEAITFFEMCFNVFLEFLTDCLLPGSGFLYLVVFTFVVYTCIVCPFWSFLHVPDDHKFSRLRGGK